MQLARGQVTYKQGRGQENRNKRTQISVGTTLNCTRISVRWVRDLTPGRNATWPGASYISKEEAKKISIREHKSRYHVKLHTNLGTMSTRSDPREKCNLPRGKLHKQGQEEAKKIAIRERKSRYHVKLHTNLGTMSTRSAPREKCNLPRGKLHKQGRGQENRNKRTQISVGTTLNCTRISVPWVRDLTPGRNATWPGASYISHASTPPHHANAFDVIVEFDSYLGKGVKVSPEIQPCVGPISHCCCLWCFFGGSCCDSQYERNHDWLLVLAIGFSAGLIQYVDGTHSFNMRLCCGTHFPLSFLPLFSSFVGTHTMASHAAFRDTTWRLHEYHWWRTMINIISLSHTSSQASWEMKCRLAEPNGRATFMAVWGKMTGESGLWWFMSPFIPTWLGIRVQYIFTLGILLFGSVGRWGWGAF